MATLKSQSTLIDDVYLHHASSSSGVVATAADYAGLLTIFSVGTNGNVYRIAPDPTDETGWRLDNLQCPERLDVIDAVQDRDGNLVVCGGNQTSRNVYKLSLPPGGQIGTWNVVRPSLDIARTIAFYDLRLRIDAGGAAEFFLLFFQRTDDPEWRYTYRVGRALTNAPSWTIAFNLDHLRYKGPQPTLLPKMTLGRSGGLPTLYLYWHEAQTIRAWRGLDGTPAISDIGVPANSQIASLFALGDDPDTTLYAAGVIGPTSNPGLYRYSAAAQGFELLSGGAVIASASGLYDSEVGYDILSVGNKGDLYHLHGSPDGAAWGAFSPMGDRVVAVTGTSLPDLGPIFIAATLDKKMRHYFQSPHTVDWEMEEIDLPTKHGEQVVWYTTKVAVLDEESRAVSGLQVLVSCPEATEILINGRAEIVGPGRSLTTDTSVVGNLVIQQSTAELSNMYVPQLRIDLLTGETKTLEAHAEVRNQLYNLTGEELKAAKGRTAPVLQPGQIEHADEIARKLRIAASLGLPPPPGVRMRRWKDIGMPQPGLVIFTPADGGAAFSLNIDLADLFQAIKERVFAAFSAAVTAIGETIVTGLNLVISTLEGAYTVFLDTMEHAFDALRSIFESVKSGFDTVLEWLGKLFDWGAIKKLAGEISTMFHDGIGSIPRALARAGLPGSIDTTFTDLKLKAVTALDHIRSQIGGSSAGTQAKKAGFTDSDSVFTFGGTSYGNQANWLMDRLTPHAAGVSCAIDLGNSGFAGLAEVWSSIDTAFLVTGEAVANNFVTLFESLATPGQALGVTIDAIFDQLEASVINILDAIEGIALKIVNALQLLASGTALSDLFETPIAFPVVSDILSAVGLGSVTLADIISYMVAIPMHVVNTIAGFPELTGTASAPVGIFLALGIIFFVIMVFTAVNDLLPEAKKILAVIPALLWIFAAILVFIAVANAETVFPELIIAAVLYIIYQGTSLFVTATQFGSPGGTRKFAIYSIVDAAVLNVLAAVWAIRMSQDPDPTKRPKAWQIAANHVGTLPDIFRWVDLVWPPPTPRPLPLRLVLAGVDVVGMGALTAGAIADYVEELQHPPSAAPSTVRPSHATRSRSKANLGSGDHQRPVSV